MILFYVHNLDENHALLEEDEFIHCIKVLRHKTGDIIHLTNGNAVFAKASISSILKRSAELEIIERYNVSKEKNKITIAVAPPKAKNRWEFMLEKIVEIGADEIIPFTSKNSERQRLNIERAEKIIRSAALQSKRIVHPKISDLMHFDKLVKTYNKSDSQIYLANYREGHKQLIDEELKHQNLMIIIGPEGDFTPEEYDLAIQNKCTPINISNNRLRTETAAIVSVSLLRSKSL